MPELESVLAQVHVQPGESCLVTEPVILRTVLGSCVGITFFVPRLGIAALCHPMLPVYPAKPKAGKRHADGTRYVDFAIRDMARKLESLGAHRPEVLVKLFGGADVLAVSSESMRPTVGRLNCESATRVVQAEGFNVVASSLGGISGINIHFHTGTGEVLLRRHS